MALESIKPNQFVARPHGLIADQWLLLSSGDFSAGKFNAMTICWGSLGYMWDMPFAQVVVRPTRFTYEFMNRYDTFTLCVFPEDHRADLQHLGTVSGRDGDKFVGTKLTPIAATAVAAPAYAEAELVIECRKVYWQDYDPSHFLDPRILGKYSGADFHRVFFGEVVALSAAEKYRD